MSPGKMVGLVLPRMSKLCKLFLAAFLHKYSHQNSSLLSIEKIKNSEYLINKSNFKKQQAIFIKKMY